MNKRNDCFLTGFVLILILGTCLGAGSVPERQRLPMNENPFGVLDFLHWNHSWNSNHYPDEASVRKTARLLAGAGIGTVRFDFLWQDIEPSPGEFDFSKYDMIVKVLRENGIAVLGILDYSADWASPQRTWNVPGDDFAPFVNYCRQVVSRYKGSVRYWELWNEPDSHTYWEPQDGMVSYVRLLKEVYAAVKKIDPQCILLNGGLAGGLCNVNRLYDNGAQGYFDALNIHIFETPLDPAAGKRVLAYIRSAAKIMARNGDGEKKIWITEIGAPGVGQGLSVGNWWMGENPGEKQQAEFLSRVFPAVAGEPAVAKVFWAFFRDTNGHWGNAVDYFGLLRNNHSPKPAYRAYKKVISDWNKKELERGKDEK